MLARIRYRRGSIGGNRRTAANLPTNTAVRLESQDGRETITLTGLDKLEEPASLITLREGVTAFVAKRTPVFQGR